MATNAVVIYLVISFVRLSSSKLIDEPEDTVAEVGDTVTLRCSVEPGPDVSVYWQLLSGDAVTYLTDDEQVYPGSTNSINERLTVVGNNRPGVFDLRIKPIYGTDSGKFLCLYFVNGHHRTSSRVATLTVLAPPLEEYPICSLTPKNNIKIGDFIRMTCVTSGGIPPARIYWKRFEEILPAYLHEQDGSVYISYEFTLSELDNGAVFTCEAISPAIKAPRFCSVKPYRNETVVRIRTRNNLIHGKDGVFDCIASAIPPADGFDWRINHELIDFNDDRFQLENYNQTLRISPLYISDNGMEITCKASNSYVVVTGNASIILKLTEQSNVNGSEVIGISIGIVVGIIITVILIYALLKYKRKRDFFKDLDFDRACRNSYVFPRQFFSRKSSNDVPQGHTNVPLDNVNENRRESRVIVCSTPQEAINIHSNELHQIPENESNNPRYSVGFYGTNDDRVNNQRLQNESDIYNEVDESEDNTTNNKISDGIYSNIEELDEEKVPAADTAAIPPKPPSQLLKPRKSVHTDINTPPKPPPQSLKPRISGPILNYSTNNSVDLENAIFVGIIDRPY